MTEYVASRTLDEVTWKGTTLLRGEAAESVAALKREADRICRCRAASCCFRHFSRTPWSTSSPCGPSRCCSGGASGCSARAATPALRLVGTETSGTGVVISTYERAGDVPIGSFQLEEPTEAEIKRRASLAG